MRSRTALAIFATLAATTATTAALASPSHRQRFTISGKTIRGKQRLWAPTEYWSICAG